jgi:hypothetical protein
MLWIRVPELGTENLRARFRQGEQYRHIDLHVFSNYSQHVNIVCDNDRHIFDLLFHQQYHFCEH